MRSTASSRRNRAAIALAAAALALLLASACDDGSGSDAPATATAAPEVSPTVEMDRAASFCDSASTGVVTGAVESPDLVEISGLVASRSSPGVLWAHNDSGGSARVFAIGEDGGQLATVMLSGAEAVDWEDLAIGLGPDPELEYLYVGDIGDNDRQRPEVAVYRFPEPAVLLDDATTEGGDVEPDKLTLVYPDAPHDAETLLVDPVSGDLYIVTKELEQPLSFVFRAPAGLEDGSTTTLERVAEINVQGLMSAREIPEDAPPLVVGVGHLPTAGDVSREGDVIAIRTYATVWLWSRPTGAELWEAFSTPPCEGPSAIEEQGEALAFQSSGLGYFTVSEGTNPPINFFR